MWPHNRDAGIRLLEDLKKEQNIVAYMFDLCKLIMPINTSLFITLRLLNELYLSTSVEFPRFYPFFPQFSVINVILFHFPLFALASSLFLNFYSYTKRFAVGAVERRSQEH